MDVGGVTVVDAHVRLVVLGVDDPQEEQLAASTQQQPVGVAILVGGDTAEVLVVFRLPVPRDGGGGRAVSLTPQRGRGQLAYVQVSGVFYNAGDVWVGESEREREREREKKTLN